MAAVMAATMVAGVHDPDGRSESFQLHSWALDKSNNIEISANY